MRTKFAIFLAGLAVAASANANLVQNGNFEAAGTAIPSWTSSGNVVTASTTTTGNNYFGAGSTAKDGTTLVAFNGGDTPANGVLSQQFGTTFGARYSVDFDFGVTSGGTQSILAQIFGVNGTTVLSSLTATSQFTGLDHFNFSFIADGLSSTIRFSDVSGNPTISQDGVLDNVSVVPEPASIALLGMGLLGFAAARRKSAK